MRNSRLMLPILLILAVAAGCAQQSAGKNAAIMPDGTAVKLEVVNYSDVAGMAGGLSYRDSICPQCGMLFVFEKAGPQSFWMRDMRFGLDMIFLDEEFKVVDVARNMEPCGEVCVPHQSKQYAKYVLEVNAGFAETHALEEGQRLQISYS